MRLPRMTTRRWMIAAVLVVVFGFVAGLAAGAVYGLRDYQAAVDADVREGGPGDYLPVGIPIWAAVGAVLGLTGGVVIVICCLGPMVAWRALANRGKQRRFDQIS